MSTYLDAVRQRVVIYDGATGTNLQLRNLTADDFGGPAFEGCNEILVDTRPDVIADLHRSFFEVGSEVVETDSFGSLSITLDEYGIADRAYELNRKAAEIAKEVAHGFTTPDTPRWVAGSIGPGTKFPSLGQIRFAEMRDAYEVQARGLLDGGVDLFIIETVFDLLQAKTAIVGCRRAMAAVGRQVPIQVQVTIELTGRMLPGTEIGAALTALEAMRPDVIGLNCATGPAEMHEHLRHLSQHCRVPISCLPNAGLPSVVDGKMHYDLTPAQLAEYHHGFVTELGVTVIGGCCGTTPEHLKAVVDRCTGPHARAPQPRPRAGGGVDLHPRPVQAGHVVPGRGRAHQRQRVEEVPRRHARLRLGHVRGHGPRPDQGGRPPPRRVRRLHRRERRRGHGRDRRPLRHPGQPAPRHRLHRAARHRGRPHVDRGQGRPQLGQPGGRRRPRHPPRPLLQPGPGVRGGRRLHLHRPGGPGPHRGRGSCGRPRPSTTSPSTATAWSRPT